MKILLRRYGDKFYTWQDAVYKNGRFYVNDNVYGESEVYEVHILAIKDDNRKDCVICAHCGEVIKNDPKSIEAHFAKKESERDCFKCASLKTVTLKNISADYTKNNDGTYKLEAVSNVNLKCGRSWYNSPQIDSAAAKSICTFYECRRHGTRPINDIFTQYPDPFDKQLTVDVLMKKNYEYDGRINGFFEYDLKNRNTVKACVNELGIVDHFVVKHRGYRFIVYYSDKYDQLFFCHDSRTYTTDMHSSMSENKYNQAKAKISALYKEVASK